MAREEEEEGEGLGTQSTVMGRNTNTPPHHRPVRWSQGALMEALIQ